jgi:hypothetical protein
MTFPFVFGLSFLVPQQLRDARVGAREQFATGVVTAYEPSNHDSCRYTFSINRQRFDGISGCPFHPGAVGAVVQVYYDPANPATSSLEDFLEARRRNEGMIPLMLLGICAVISAILFSKYRHRTKKT